MNRNILERVRCMLSFYGLPTSFLTEALSTECHMVNRSPLPTIRLKKHREMWSGDPTNYENLRFFGCVTYAHINQGKLEHRAKKYILGISLKGERLQVMLC